MSILIGFQSKLLGISENIQSKWREIKSLHIINGALYEGSNFTYNLFESEESKCTVEKYSFEISVFRAACFTDECYVDKIIVKLRFFILYLPAFREKNCMEINGDFIILL